VRPAPRPTAAEVVAAKRETRQEQMQFEPVTRGRFEKSEPTIVDGQDLDVPTFLRRNVRPK
jgi:cell division protein FtsZ